MSLIHWFEIPAANFDRAVAFYQQVLQLQLKQEDCMTDRIAVFPDSSGCIMASPRLPAGGQGCQIYLDGGPDLAATLQRVKTAGGKVLLPITTLEDGNGDIALIEDSEGNSIGLHLQP
ncbi:VOC family protein [Aquitalea aquatilis]|uniref:VOC family protein n=1 Tax=Aquitalea aquatilis TaxID=1537400 RepID=UPI0010BD63A3|nr:VOC family protein [Aquitalea aquatilis]